MTIFPVADTGKPMGRPPLKPEVATVKTTIRLPKDLLQRVEKASGDRPVAEFIRASLEAELERRNS